MSSPWMLSTRLNLYWKPEQPPASTLNLSFWSGVSETISCSLCSRTPG